MALLRKEFTWAQQRSHTRRVCEYQLFLRSVLCDGISCLDQENIYLENLKKFYMENFKKKLFGKFKKCTIWEISKKNHLENSKNFQFVIFQEFPKFYNFENYLIFIIKKFMK